MTNHSHAEHCNRRFLRHILSRWWEVRNHQALLRWQALEPRICNAFTCKKWLQKYLESSSDSDAVCWYFTPKVSKCSLSSSQEHRRLLDEQAGNTSKAHHNGFATDSPTAWRQKWLSQQSFASMPCSIYQHIHTFFRAHHLYILFYTLYMYGINLYICDHMCFYMAISEYWGNTNTVHARGKLHHLAQSSPSVFNLYSLACLYMHIHVPCACIYIYILYICECIVCIFCIYIYITHDMRYV